MPSSEKPPATVVMTGLEPGLVYFQIVEPNLPHDRVELLLIKSIDTWFQANPQYVLDRTQDRFQAGRLRGIHVWYDELATQEPRSTHPSVVVPTTLTFDVSESILNSVTREYLEALVAEATEIASSHPHSVPSLVIVNARKIAVVIDFHANRGDIVPVDRVDPRLHESTRHALATWLASPTTRLSVIKLDQSWFAPELLWTKTQTYRDCSFQRTNMVYDPASRFGAIRAPGG